MPILERYRGSVVAECRYVWRRLTAPRYASIHGVLLATEGDHISAGLRRMIYRETYEDEELTIVENHLRPDDIVLEIGAGLGAVATLCAKKLGDSGRVHTFEANPAMESILRDTFALNSVEPSLTMGFVADQEGEKQLFLADLFCSASALRRKEDAPRIPVSGISLQGLLQRIQPTFLIVDVEGYEYQLFRNVDLDPVYKICLELHPHIIGNAACTDVLRNLANQGFAIQIEDCASRVFYLERERSSEQALGPASQKLGRT